MNHAISPGSSSYRSASFLHWLAGGGIAQQFNRSGRVQHHGLVRLIEQADQVFIPFAFLASRDGRHQRPRCGPRETSSRAVRRRNSRSGNGSAALQPTAAQYRTEAFGWFNASAIAEKSSLPTNSAASSNNSISHGSVFAHSIGVVPFVLPPQLDLRHKPRSLDWTK